MTSDAPRLRRVRRTLPLAPAAAAAAREFVRELLERSGLTDHVHTVELVVTELVTNAVHHAGPHEDIGVEISAGDDRIRLSVLDGSAIRPVARQVGADETSGRGLYIVEQLVDRWGTEDHAGGGKEVWVELDVPSAR